MAQERSKRIRHLAVLVVVSAAYYLLVPAAASLRADDWADCSVVCTTSAACNTPCLQENYYCENYGTCDKTCSNYCYITMFNNCNAPCDGYPSCWDYGHCTCSANFQPVNQWVIGEVSSEYCGGDRCEYWVVKDRLMHDDECPDSNDYYDCIYDGPYYDGAGCCSQYGHEWGDSCS